jgi:MFS transporter, SP family, sugar:H+ symporter
VAIVYYFLSETNNKSLEEIDTMFPLEVPPTKSSKWKPPRSEDLITADKLMLNRGVSRIGKRQEARQPGAEYPESVPGQLNPHDLISGVRGNSFYRAWNR